MTGQQNELIVCSKCGVEATRYRPGMRQCAQCVRARARLRNATRAPELKRASAAKWRSENPEKIIMRRQQEAVKAGRVYRTKEQMADERQLDKWAAAVMWRVKLARRMRRRAPSMTEAERYRHNYATLPAFVINARMRTSIKKALRGGKAGRAWESLVGYTILDLMVHLERQMPKGYTLDDFGSGRIHIDHIIPKSMFDVTKPDELRACWALANLRPVTAKVNLKKGSKRDRLL